MLTLLGVGLTPGHGQVATSTGQPADDPATPRWLSLTLGGDLRDQREQMPDVRVEPQTGQVPGESAPRQIANTAFGVGTSPDAVEVDSFDASLAYLRSVAPTLSGSDRRLVLSVMGDRLSAGYSRTVTNNPSMESVFQNARAGGHEGGICGDIHTYLSRVQPTLGFDSAGTMTAYWWIAPNAGGGHAVAYFRDPGSGEYILQNYGQLFLTRQTTVQNLVEVSTRILGYAWVSSVESRPGTMHEYVARPARWVSHQVGTQASASVHDPVLSLTLTNREQAGSVQYGWASQRQQVKVYAIGSRFVADEGDYDLADAGFAYSFRDRVRLDWGWLDAAGLAATGHVDALRVGQPLLRAAADPTRLRSVSWHASSRMIGGTIHGTLQKGGTTLSAGFDGDEIGLPTSGRADLFVALNQTVPTLPLSLTYERVWNRVDANGQPKNAQQTVVAYDRLGARVHLGDGRPVSAGVGANVFALEGIESGAGSALRLEFDARWETRFGAFTLVQDWGKVLSNPDRDPFYALPGAQSTIAGWERSFGRRVVLGLQAGYAKGPRVQPFGTFGGLTPELDDGSRQVFAQLAVRFAY